MTPAALAPPDRRHPAVDELVVSLRGAVAVPGSADYARLTEGFDLAVPLRPMVAVEPADAYDVARAVRVAAWHGLRVAVHLTGHGAAPVDGAVLLHTGALDQCVVHPEGWARVGAGVRWRTVVEAAAPFGLAPLAGSSSAVGVVGYTTGGGLGPMARTFGLASDRVRALDVVTGEGRLVRATPIEHADLFWALRGGRGSLGIVTAVEFDLVPVSAVYGGSLHFAADDAAAVLHAWRAWSADLPEEVTTSLALVQLPDLPHVPPALAGRTTVSVRVVDTGGDTTRAEQRLAPLRAVATPVLDAVGVLPVTELDRVHSDPAGPMPLHQTGALLRELTAGTVEALLGAAGPGTGSPLALLELRRLGGALRRPGRVDSAVCGRDADALLHCVAVPGDGVPERTDAVLAAVAPWTAATRLPSFGGRAPAYDRLTLARLRALVRSHDPARVLLGADALFAEGPV